jgi:general secretion pathway protein G
MVVPKMREPNPRTLRQRTIENIWRENEQKKAELQGGVPAFLSFRSPKLYIVIIFIMAAIGMVILSRTDKAVEQNRTRISPEMRALRNLDVLAEALGRYHFHTGHYPTLRQGGLGALVHDPGKEREPAWDGPYISHISMDPWGTPYVYEPPEKKGELPILFSSGPDRLPNTADDLKPDPARFDPGTEWTNDWVRAQDRIPGVINLNP